MVKMKINVEKSVSRREFLKSGLRTLLLGVVLFVSGLLGWREIRSAEDENICVIKSSCRDCSKYADCTNPKIEESKQDIASQ